MSKETDANEGESSEVQFDCQRSAGDEEGNDDKESIFSLVVNTAPNRVATPVERAAQAPLLIQPLLRWGGPHNQFS